MVIDWIIAIYLIIIINSFGLAFLVLRAWLSLKKNDKVVNKTTSNYMMINKLKRRVDDIESFLSTGGGGNSRTEESGSSQPLSLPDSLDDALKQWDIDSKLVNNPIVKPMAEKIYQQIKNRASSHNQENEDNNVGY